jgi:hypothetical protein
MGRRLIRNVRFSSVVDAERWKAPEPYKDALTVPQVCIQFTSAAVHFVFVGTVE